MDGRILSGQYEGKLLSDMMKEDVFDLYNWIQQDQESVAWLEAFLDRRFPQWREYTDANNSPTAQLRL
ncbi:MAG: hypothetical protein GY742_09755 [Hyphomicrobiales bacterium]|nr:hypothetical protein [Hyphomicrobiales bacterium]